MYEIDAAKFTSKPNPKQEFRQYYKDSGAAAALQRAMMLLYRMPVKPANLAEYLSQYFENGAQQIMKISLLKAELCYKREELQNKRMKVEETENRIKQLIDKLGLTEEEFEQKYIPARIRDKNRLSIVERYFKELESGKRRMTENEFGDLGNPNPDNLDPTMRNVYDSEKECMKTSSSQYSIGEDMRELDPWGIICKGTRVDDVRKSKEGKDGPEEHEPSDDEDEGTSLAEQFQQSSQDWLHEKDEGDANKSKKILTVKKAENVRQTDFQGWTPLTSEERLDISTFRFQGPNTDEFRDDEDTERIQVRTCAIKPTDMLKFQGNAKIDLGSHEPDNDAFLLDDDQFEEVLKIMETNQETFDFELPRYSREERKSITKDICDPMCSTITDYDKICSASVGTVAYDDVDTAAAYGGEYYYDSNESLGFIPGKMVNWTANMHAYPSSSSPGEYNEFNGEGAPIMNKVQCDLKSKTRTASKVPLDVPMTRIDTSCHCVFSGSYDTNEMLNENENRIIVVEVKKKSTDGEDKGKRSSKKGARGSQQKDESTITEDTQLESELQEVFKQKQNRRSTLKKEKQKEVPSEDQLEDPSHTTELFGMDFAKEVKKALLGFSPSELNNPGVDISQIPQPSKTGSFKSKTQAKAAQ